MQLNRDEEKSNSQSIWDKNSMMDDIAFVGTPRCMAIIFLGDWKGLIMQGTMEIRSGSSFTAHNASHSSTRS